jgi:hypothetical protein
MPETDARAAVLAELRHLRKRSEGVTVDALAATPTITHLLGAGDAQLAFTRLQHHLIDEAHERTIKAAAAALGLSSGSNTVLGRLEDGARDLSVDQRHVRRLSDQGLEALASFITSSWLVEAVPELTLYLVLGRQEVDLAVTTTRPEIIAMRPPAIEVISPAGAPLAQSLTWAEKVDGRFVSGRSVGLTAAPLEPGELASMW